jgi:UDP-3-O-[3-hydroxymyristoyl] glucosamine N-acyltransferase
MTISTTTTKNSHTGNASATTFAYNFKILDDDDIEVIKTLADGTTTTLTKSTHYTVAGVGADSGSVTISGTALAANESVTLNRKMSFTQPTDLQNQGGFFAEVHETAFDRQAMYALQNQEGNARTLTIPVTETLDMTLPSKDNRKGKILGFHATTGAPEASASLTSVNTLAAITANINTVAGIASNVTAVAGDATDIGAVAAKATEIGRLGTSDAVADMAILGTNAVVADMAILGTNDVVADMAILATNDVVADMNVLGTSDVVTDMNLLATSTVVGNMNLLGTAAVVEDMGLLGTAAVVADLNLLGTSDVVADMALLATSDVISDMNALATSDIISDLNTLATSDIVTDMNLLATSANVAAMGHLGTSANVSAQALLGTSAVVADMALLGTSAVVEDMALLGTAAVVEDMALLSTSAVVADMALLGTSDVVADMALLGTSAVVADLAILGTSDVVSDMNTLATSDIVTDMNVLGTSANVTAMNTLGTSANVTAMSTVSGAIANVNTTASNIAGVNSFAARYRIASSAPSSDLDEGDLYYNTSSNVLFFYNGSAWVQLQNYTHPNHSGEVTSTADGATVIAGNVVDEANLKVSNAPSNGQYLQAQSGNTGGLTWAAVDALPTQTSNSGKFLTTNGSAASWAVLDTDANTTTKGLYEMANVISANYVIGNNNNAMSAGPITINSNISVTVPSGSTWVIA